MGELQHLRHEMPVPPGTQVTEEIKAEYCPWRLVPLVFFFFLFVFLRGGGACGPQICRFFVFFLFSAVGVRPRETSQANREVEPRGLVQKPAMAAVLSIRYMCLGGLRLFPVIVDRDSRSPFLF